METRLQWEVGHAASTYRYRQTVVYAFTLPISQARDLEVTQLHNCMVQIDLPDVIAIDTWTVFASDYLL
jgi:hypothetical protein